jgi:hypothetical protein
VPAAAVIPAPIAYIKVAAVKKLVVDNRRSPGRSCSRRHCPVGLYTLACGRAGSATGSTCRSPGCPSLGARGWPLRLL